MTAVDPSARASQPAASETPEVDRPVTVMCPYLAAADGAWRSTTAAREHRCGAVSPPAPLASEKQRRLCLTADYGTCSTYEAARSARPMVHARASALPRPLARTTPTVLDHGRIVIAVPALRSDRSTAQALLIGLLALAFAAIVLARAAGGGTPAAVAGSPSAGATARPSATSSAAPTAVSSATAQPDPSAAPSAVPAASAARATSKPTTAATRTYKVKAGDTLIGIAARFGTTYAAIAKLNGLASGSSLRIGQVLKIP